MLNLLSLLACNSEPDKETLLFEPTEMQMIEVGEQIATVSDKHLSVALDLGQVLGANFWNPDIDGEEAEIPYPEYDFTRPQLVTLASELSPALLRIGGTESDRIYYAMDGEVPDPLPEGYTSVLTSTHWDRLVTFAEVVGFDLFITVNAGVGPRVDGVWTTENIERLFAYAAAENSPVDVWEFGNEPNGFPLFYGFNLDPVQYAADTHTFKTQVDQWFPDSQIAGPAVAYWPMLGEFSPYTGEVIANEPALDIVTWHYYPTQSARCPVQNRLGTVDTLQDPVNLDEILVWHNQIESQLNEHDLDVELWLGETGNAQCGGVPNVSDKWAGSMWWVDQLGLMASRGEPVMIRQTLSGSNYGLLNDETLLPNPDYWVSVLWKRLMGREVLSVDTNDLKLRVYGHCHPNGGRTLVGVNLHTDRNIGIENSGGLVYTLESDALDTDTVRLNGTELKLDNGSLPALQGMEQDTWVIPAQGVSFLHQANQACVSE